MKHTTGILFVKHHIIKLVATERNVARKHRLFVVFRGFKVDIFLMLLQ